MLTYSFQNTLGNSQTNKSVLVFKRRTFDKVEEKMNHIQASLSSTSLMKSELDVQHFSNVDENVAMRLKTELEEKEIIAQKYYICMTCSLCCKTFFIRRLQDQLNNLKSQTLDCDSNLSNWEEQLIRKRRQIKKKKEQLRRIQDDG